MRLAQQVGILSKLPGFFSGDAKHCLDVPMEVKSNVRNNGLFHLLITYK